MMLPALRSQMKLSAGKPITPGNNLFNRGSMHVMATTGNSLA
jgi:hypothetical protein